MDTPQLNPQILSFCETLLSKKGMDAMPDDIKADMLMDLYTRFENWILVYVAEKVDEKDQEAFDNILADFGDGKITDSGGLYTALGKLLPNLEDIIIGAMEEFAKTYLGDKA